MKTTDALLQAVEELGKADDMLIVARAASLLGSMGQPTGYYRRYLRQLVAEDKIEDLAVQHVGSEHLHFYASKSYVENRKMREAGARRRVSLIQGTGGVTVAIDGQVIATFRYNSIEDKSHTVWAAQSYANTLRTRLVESGERQGV